jgi:L-seryl-tRNA(Ser) seleniumtransferase
VINGTGIVVHTNLGRAPLGSRVVRELEEIARSYNNLEFDLSTGERGSRGTYIEQCLASANSL